MTRHASTAARIAMLAFAASVLPAQEPPVTDSVRNVRAATAMTSDLRNLGTAQEAFFSDNLRYAASVTDLAKTFRTSAGVSVTLLSASATGHSATAVHRDAPGVVCAFGVNVLNPISQSKEDAARPVCRMPDGTLWRYTRPR